MCRTGAVVEKRGAADVRWGSIRFVAGAGAVGFPAVLKHRTARAPYGFAWSEDVLRACELRAAGNPTAPAFLMTTFTAHGVDPGKNRRTQVVYRLLTDCSTSSRYTTCVLLFFPGRRLGVRNDGRFRGTVNVVTKAAAGVGFPAARSSQARSTSSLQEKP